MLKRLVWWRKPADGQPVLTGWALDLDPETRAIHLEAARTQTDALMAFIADQDSKVMQLFGLTVLLAGASGVFGTLKLGTSTSQLVDLGMIGATVVAWTMSLLAYRPRRFDIGLSPAKLRDDFADITAHTLPAFLLEVWTNSYSANLEIMRQKSRWLRWLMYAVVVQASLVVVVEVVR